MTTKRTMTMVFALFAFTFMAVAQVVTNVPPVGGLEPLPKSMAEFWTLGIAAVTPLIVAGIYKLIPKVPKLLLPVATPFIGIGLGLLVNWLGAKNYGWIDMAQAGALAVFVREVFNQAAKLAVVQSMTGIGSPTPPAPPTS